MKLPLLSFLMLFFFLISCKKKGGTSFYIVNNSAFTSADTIQVYIDEKLLINEKFTYSNVVPNDKLFKANLSAGQHIISVRELKYGVEARDTIDALSEKYIFISFNESQKNTSHPDSLNRRIIIHKRKKFTKIY